MKYIREALNTIIKPIAQKYADFLITKLDQSTSDEEFQMWFNQAIYLDFYCTSRDIYLD